jgi:hypothetical protein
MRDEMRVETPDGRSLHERLLEAAAGMSTHWPTSRRSARSVPIGRLFDGEDEKVFVANSSGYTARSTSSRS